MNMKSKEQMIHEAAMEILRDVGVVFHNDDAVEILKANGIQVEDHTAFFTEEQVMHWVKMAPSSFTLYARNPKHDMVIGGDHVHAAPAYGCAFTADREGNKHPGTIADYVKCARLVQEAEVYDINGGITIQPCDVADDTAPVDMFYATILNSDKVIMIPTGNKNIMEGLMKAGCEMFGGEEAFAEKPRMITLINTNSPLSLDGRMLDCLMTLAKYGQPVIVCPAAMLGATGPLPIAGTLASGTAEDLAGIALAQMIRPGTPVVFGMQSNAMDMKGMIFACGSPEGALMQAWGARMARFYDLPSRGGGSQTDAPVVNVQAGYESMLTFFSASAAGMNLIMEAGGIVDSVNATSFDKLLVDMDIIRQVKIATAPLEVNEETIDMEEIKECEHDGSFLTCDYTLDNFMDLYMPRIGARGAKGSAYIEENIDKEMARMLEAHAQRGPKLDDDLKARVRAVLVQETGISAQQLDAIEAL